VDLDAEHRPLVIRIQSESRRSTPDSQNVPSCNTVFAQEPATPCCVSSSYPFEEEMMGRGILLWLLGVPIPVIILLWLFFGR
jgi:hypothetical protein